MAREQDHQPLTVDGITYDLDAASANIPPGLFQLVPDGSRQQFPHGAMRTTPADLDAADDRN